MCRRGDDHPFSRGGGCRSIRIGEHAMSTTHIRRLLGGPFLLLLLGLLCAPRAAAQVPDLAWVNSGTGPIATALSPDGQMLATGGANEYSVKLWRTADGSYIRTI